MSGNIQQSPYAEFHEFLCKSVMEHQPVKMAVVAILPDGGAFTTAFGDCGPYDLALMGFHMQADAMMDIAKANAQDIVQAAEEGDEDDESS